MHLWTILAFLVPFWAHLEAILGHFVTILGHLGAILGLVGATLKTKASKIAPTAWNRCPGRPFWDVLGSIVGSKNISFDVFVDVTF